MPAAVRLRDDYSAKEVRRLAARCKDANRSRRLLAIAAIYDGMNRGEAARIGGMERQTLRDWVIRFNARGPESLVNQPAPGRQSWLNADQLRELSQAVETGPDPTRDGVVRWRRIDLKRLIEERFGVVYAERSISKLLADLGFVHISVRPRHPAQDATVVEAFKNVWPAPLQAV
jgi:putative transposase